MKEIATKENEEVAQTIFRISQLAFKTGSPWTGNEFYQSLAQQNTNHIILYKQGKAAGFLLYQKVLDEIEIFQLAILPHFRRKGLGQELLQLLLAKTGSKNEKTSVYLEVRASNKGARSFYKQMFFKEIGKRKNYYNEPVEDGIIMQLQIK